MEVNKVQYTQPSFGMIIAKDNKAVDNFLFKNFKSDDAVMYRYLQSTSDFCPVDVYLSVVKKYGKDRLQAEVGPKKFTSGFFKSPMRAIKQAIKHAREIEHENYIAKQSEGMAIPTIG